MTDGVRRAVRLTLETVVLGVAMGVAITLLIVWFS